MELTECNESRLHWLLVIICWGAVTEVFFSSFLLALQAPSEVVFYSPLAGFSLTLTRFHDHIQRHTTVGRTPLNEWSVRRRDLYLTTHNTYNRQTSMPRVGFEPTISAGERPKTYALDRAATGTGLYYFTSVIFSSFSIILFTVFGYTCSVRAVRYTPAFCMSSLKLKEPNIQSSSSRKITKKKPGRMISVKKTRRLMPENTFLWVAYRIYRGDFCLFCIKVHECGTCQSYHFQCYYYWGTKVPCCFWFVTGYACLSERLSLCWDAMARINGSEYLDRWQRKLKDEQEL